MKDRAVLVCTEHRGVFFGYADSDMSGASVNLKRVRNCVYWSEDVKGFLGLATTGPSKSCRVGPQAPEITLHKVTCVVGVTDAARDAWEAAPWK